MSSRKTRNEREETPVVRGSEPQSDLLSCIREMEVQRQRSEDHLEKIRREDVERMEKTCQEERQSMQQQFSDLFKMQLEQQRLQMEQQKLQMEQQLEQQKGQWEQQHRYWQAQQEKEQQDQEMERQRWQYQLQKDQEEKTRQERRDIPKIAPMDKDTDVDEYLEVFEGLMQKLGKAEHLWSSYLQPVMNNTCRTVFTSMPQDKRDDYKELKKALMSTCSTEHIRVGAAFWTYERQKGQTFPQMERKLTRLGQRFALKTTPEETLDCFVLEKLLQTLPHV
jgi:hypothetical protein